VLVAPACNPSYSRGRDQEDQGLKPARARPYLEKKSMTKKGWWSVLSVGPEFKPQQHTHKKNLFPMIVNISALLLGFHLTV
jgi:hypothetical protein